MGLIKKRSTIKVSKNDPYEGYLADKIKQGTNVKIEIEKDEDQNERLIISSEISPKTVQTLNTSGIIDSFIVLIDASKNHVVATLPLASSYNGQLQVICADASHGIEIATTDKIFDTSSLQFNAKGDAYTFVSDRVGTWYIVGRYAPQWYA